MRRAAARRASRTARRCRRSRPAATGIPTRPAVTRGPDGKGHLGDLPVLVVAADGTATEAVTAPRITDPSRLEGLALMIHAGGDNYSDQPKALGGGGARLACGIIE